MTRDAIITLVKAYIDELSPFSDTDLNPSIENIDPVLDNSARTIARVAPNSLLTPATISGTPVVDTPVSGVITIPLSADFLKIHSVKLTDWQQEVTRPITVEDPKYKLQRYPTLRGGTAKPVVVLKSTATGKAIECYSYSTNATVQYALYVAFTVAEALPDDLLEPIAWQCAADVIMSMKGNPEGALLKVQEFFKTQ